MASSTLVPISSISLRSSPSHRLSIPLFKPFPLLHSTVFLLPISSSSSSSILSATRAKSSDIDTTFFDNVNPQEDIVYDPPEVPEGFVPPPSFDEGPIETEEEIAAGYEEIYGPAYSGVSVLGNDIYVMDSKVKKAGGFGSKAKKDKPRDGFDERVVQVRRVTKVVKRAVTSMLIPKKDRLTVYNYLFNEGVLCAKKDFHAPKHAFIDVPNLYVIKLAQSLRSRGYVREEFSWQWYYYFLTNEGIEYLREYLHLGEDVVPATLKKPKPKAVPERAPGERREGGGFRGGRRPFDADKKAGAPGEFQPSYRGDRGERPERGERGERGERSERGGRGGFSRGGGRDSGYRREDRGEGGRGGYSGGFRGGRGGQSRPTTA